jgi:hypothetical protein
MDLQRPAPFQLNYLYLVEVALDILPTQLRQQLAQAAEVED